MDDDTSVGDVEAFAASHLGLLAHVARLITGDRATGDDLAVEGMRCVHANRDQDDNDDERLGTALVAIARAAQRLDGTSWTSRPHGGLELHDRRPDPPLEHVPDEDADAAVGDALSALTDRERAVTVLQLLGGLDTRATARAVRRPTWVVRRDYARAMEFLGEVAGGGDFADDQARVRRALGPAPTSGMRIEALLGRLSTSIAADPPKHRSRRTIGVATAAVAVVALALAAAGLDQLRHGEPTSTARMNDTQQPSPVQLPVTPSGLKIVGFKGVMVTVPEAWNQAAGPCARVQSDTVVYPIWGRPAPCQVAATTGTTVSFGYASEVRHASLNRSVDEAGADRVAVTALRRHGGAFVQYAVMIDADVAVAVRSASRRQVSAIVSSVSATPPGYVVMPNCLDMDPDEALRVLDDRTLSGHIYTDSAGSAGLPVHVVTQNPPVGTLLPLGTTVSLGVLPR